MRLKLHRDAIYLVWPASHYVPEWAWRLAGRFGFRIACYGEYENALEWRVS